MADADVRKSYLEDNRGVRLQRSRVGCVVTLALVPTGASLDLSVYPAQAADLLTLRFSAELLVGLIYVLHRFDWFARYIKWTGMLMPAVLVLTFCAMIYITDGFTGPYYAGLNLLLVGVSLLLPYGFLESLILSIGALGLYLLTGVLTGLESIDFRLAFSNTYFIFATGIIACTASYFSERARFREYRLTFELDQRNRQLAELDRIKSDFFANISHELRTPLTLILSPIEDLLKKGGSNPHVQKQLIYVRDNAYRLLKLVNDLLDVMRLEEGRSRLERQAVNLSTMVTNVVAGMRHFAEQQQVSIEVQAEDNVVISGDASAMEKITINLVNNAIKFTEPGGKVNVRVLASQDQYGEMVVEDTGTGISAKDLPYIFDRFKQADSSSTRKHQGTGLGLALVKELTELQQGQIEAQSELGKGTCMKVRLPILDSADEHVPVRQEVKEEQMELARDHLAEIHRRAAYSYTSTRDSADSPAAGQGDAPDSDSAPRADRPRVVVVEDEPDVRRYLVDVLGSDFDLQVAKDGEEGLALIKQTMPDMALLDLMLPKIDGLSLCKMIKQDQELQHIKVMLLTARTDEQSKMTALDHGADDFLTKPFSTVEISKRLFNLWHTSRLQENLRVKNIELSQTLEELQRTQGKLIQSEKLNALGRLAAGLLHEVNNPLNYAFGTLQLLEREPSMQEDAGIKEMMSDIRDGMQRISQIVRDLKTFAYPETSEMKKEFRVLDAVNSAIRLTGQKNKPAHIELDFDPQLVGLGSQSHIVQVLINLIENSMHAIEASRREGQIRIQAGRPGGGGRIKLCVRDNGSGIPQAVIDKVFDPFFTTKDVGQGLGMGLSTCHTIVNNHGGTLTVDSDGKSYTEFCFDIEAA